jgi:hypothetical protein
MENADQVVRSKRQRREGKECQNSPQAKFSAGKGEETTVPYQTRYIPALEEPYTGARPPYYSAKQQLSTPW